MGETLENNPDGKTAAKALPFVSPKKHHTYFPEEIVLPEKVAVDWDDIPQPGINHGSLEHVSDVEAWKAKGELVAQC